MAIASWQLVRVYGTWTDANGAALAGTYTISVTRRLTNATDDLIIPAGVFKSGALSTGGSVSLDVMTPATDDVDIEQTGWPIQVDIRFTDTARVPESYLITVPYANRPVVDGGNGFGVNLRTVALATEVAPVIATYGVGIPGGLARLSIDGQSVLNADGVSITSGVQPGIIDAKVDGYGVTAIRGLTQAAYTALAVKDPYTAYLTIQGDGSIITRYVGGAVDPTPPSSTPTAPGGSVSSVTQTSITLGSITAPSSNGGSAITGYKFFAYNPAGTSASTFNPEYVTATILPGALPTSFTFTNMVAGVTYQVGAFAMNANGEGARLRISQATTALTETGGGGVGGSSGLPAKVSAMWYNKFQRPRLRELPSDVRTINNHYILAIAQSGGSGTGNIAFGPSNGETAAELKADVLALRAAGANVCIGIGGSSDGGIAITNSTQVTQAYNSIVSIVTNYGVNGLDIDLEPSGSTWNQTSLVSLVSQLKTNYGSSFIVGITPGLYDSYTATWMALYNAMSANVDYVAPMLYDFPESRDSRLTQIAVQKCDVMAAASIPQSKMILGFMCRSTAGTGDGYPASTPQVTLDAYNAAKAKYPNIRGAFIWESYIEGTAAYQWTRLTGKAIRGL